VIFGGLVARTGVGGIAERLGLYLFIFCIPSNILVLIGGYVAWTYIALSPRCEKAMSGWSGALWKDLRHSTGWNGWLCGVEGNVWGLEILMGEFYTWLCEWYEGTLCFRACMWVRCWEGIKDIFL